MGQYAVREEPYRCGQLTRGRRSVTSSVFLPHSCTSVSLNTSGGAKSTTDMTGSGLPSGRRAVADRRQSFGTACHSFTTSLGNSSTFGASESRRKATWISRLSTKNETLTSFDKGMRMRTVGIAPENAPSVDLHEMRADEYVIDCSADKKTEVSSGDNAGVMFIVIASGLVDGESKSRCGIEAYEELVE